MSSPSDELLHVAKLMREALTTCILPWFGKLTADQVGEKGPEDFVTIADTSAELFLGARLVEFRPGSRIIGEEGVAANPALLQTLADGACWIIDPVDGTWLFKHSLPHFGTLVSRSQDGVTQAGWVLETYLDKNGALENRILMGDAVSGVWHSNGAGESFQPILPFDKKLVPTTNDVHMNFRDFSNGFIKKDFESQTFTFSETLYSSASIYSSLIRSESVAGFSAGSMPWDHAAGAFLLQCLGGVSTHLTDNTSYSPNRLGFGIGNAISREIYDLAFGQIFLPSDQWPQRDPDVRKA